MKVIVSYSKESVSSSFTDFHFKEHWSYFHFWIWFFIESEYCHQFIFHDNWLRGLVVNELDQASPLIYNVVKESRTRAAFVFQGWKISQLYLFAKIFSMKFRCTVVHGFFTIRRKRGSCLIETKCSVTMVEFATVLIIGKCDSKIMCASKYDISDPRSWYDI